MKHSIATVSLSGTLLQKTKAIAGSKYDGVELFENDLIVSNISPDEYRKVLEDYNLELIGLQPFRDFEAMPEPFRLRNFERAKYKFDLMHKLGTNTLFICSNTSIHAIDNPEIAAKDLYDLAELAKKEGFRIGYEALSWGRFVNTYHQSVAIVDKANHPNLGNILDNFHISAVNSDFEAIKNIPKDKITVVQVADAPKLDMGPMHLGRHYRSFPGQGSFPVIDFLKAVVSTGYDSYISHEIFFDDFRNSSTDRMALDGKRSLIWLSNELKTKPENFEIEDFAFIEISCQGMYKSGFMEILENLNFQRTYQHKTKDITVFKNGEIVLMLNFETNYWTNSESLNVNTIAFFANSIDQTKSWANHLKYPWKQDFNLTNSISISGVGDISYLFLERSQSLDSYLDTEFTKNPEIDNTHDLLRIDHLGHTCQHQVYSSNTMFFRAFLGFSITDSQALFDPKGIVYSRLASNSNGKIKMPLSTSSNSKTATNQFIHREDGARIQQLAIESNDVFATAKAISNKDLILKIPSNYYADLESKCILNKSVLAEMQELNIMYDVRDEGEFFHFYFKELDGFFVELVQRIGNYSNFGEANSQIRLSAQAQS